MAFVYMVGLVIVACSLTVVVSYAERRRGIQVWGGENIPLGARYEAVFQKLGAPTNHVTREDAPPEERPKGCIVYEGY